MSYVADFSQLAVGDKKTTVLTALQDYGFCVLQNHGFDETILEEAFAATKNLFKFLDANPEKKETLILNTAEENRGFVANTEDLNGTKNNHESFIVGNDNKGSKENVIFPKDD